MSIGKNMRREDVVDRAARALREAPVPAAPPPEVLAAVAEAGRETKLRKNRKGVFRMNITKIAAAIVIVVGLAGVVVWQTIGTGGATIAWADVQEKIRSTRAMAVTVTIHTQGSPTAVKLRMMTMEPGLIRQEISVPEPLITIADLSTGRILTLSEKEKKAVFVDMGGLPEAAREGWRAQDFLGRLKEWVRSSGEEVGEKEIDGRPVKGYRVSQGEHTTTLWVDATTAVPVEIEMKGALGSGSVLEMSDFEFDKEVEESLFSQEVPPGYTKLEYSIDLSNPTLEDVVESLRMWVPARGGTFPETLGPSEIAEEAQKLESGLSEEEEIRMGESLARMFMFLAQHPGARYVGAGVKFGDAAAPVFWYKPKDSETYRVIYGDLSIKEVAAKDLPAAPAAETE